MHQPRTPPTAQTALTHEVNKILFSDNQKLSLLPWDPGHKKCWWFISWAESIWYQTETWVYIKRNENRHWEIVKMKISVDDIFFLFWIAPKDNGLPKARTVAIYCGL